MFVVAENNSCDVVYDVQASMNKERLCRVEGAVVENRAADER